MLIFGGCLLKTRDQEAVISGIGFSHQVQRHQGPTDIAERPEQSGIGGQGQTGKVDLEELGVTVPISRRMENGVQVVKDILRSEGLKPVPLPLGNKGQAETVGASINKCGGKIGRRLAFVSDDEPRNWCPSRRIEVKGKNRLGR